MRICVHMTWVTYSSRVSERMIQYKVRKWEGVFLDVGKRKFIYKLLLWKLQEEEITYYALNVLSDHVHLIACIENNEIEEIVRKLKWFSSFKISKDFLYSESWVGRQNKIWWKWYSLTYLNTQMHLDTAVKYVNDNHLKHWVENILDI